LPKLIVVEFLLRAFEHIHVKTHELRYQFLRLRMKRKKDPELLPKSNEVAWCLKFLNYKQYQSTLMGFQRLRMMGPLSQRDLTGSSDDNTKEIHNHEISDRPSNHSRMRMTGAGRFPILDRLCDCFTKRLPESFAS